MDAVDMALYVPRAINVPGGFLFLPLFATARVSDHPEPLHAASEYVYVKIQGLRTLVSPKSDL